MLLGRAIRHSQSRDFCTYRVTSWRALWHRNFLVPISVGCLQSHRFIDLWYINRLPVLFRRESRLPSLEISGEHLAVVFSPAKLNTTDSSSIPHMSILEFFLLFYPCDSIKIALRPQTNNHLNHRDMDLSEFLRFSGCWLYMASFEGVVDRHMWWSNTEVNMFEGAPGRITKYMSLNRFE